MGGGLSLKTCPTVASPKVSPLTVENLARHEASLECTGATCLHEQEPPPVQNEVPATADPDALARQEAYRQRKQARKKRGLNAGKDAGVFLSNLPEVAADVKYRFNLIVIGDGSTPQQLVQQTCESSAARKLSCSNEEPKPTSPRSGHAASAPQAFRCLSALVAPSGKAIGEDLIKLAFHPVALHSDIPTCTSRLEALSTLMVFVLTIDGPSGKKDRFRAQLQSVLDATNSLRVTTQPKHRPMRVFLLCSTAEDQDGATGPLTEMTWFNMLSDFDDSHGITCKFGPLSLQNSDALYATFAEMASTRILQCQLDKAGNPDQGPQSVTGGEQDDPDEDDGEEAARRERAMLEERLQLSNTRFLKGTMHSGSSSRSSSHPSSSRSQGWQKPPVFEAEIDGSEAEKDALEAHARVYGAHSTAPELLT